MDWCGWYSANIDRGSLHWQIKPILSPLVHEAQSAKIIIGPLICDPKPLNDWSKFNLETNVKNLAQKIEISINDTKSSLNEEIEKLKKFHEKPICLGEGYKIIFGVCYYFEKTEKSFEDALSNCKGKLYEPTDVTTFKQVQSEAKSIFGSNYINIWTGFTKIDNTGNLKHSSTGLKLYGEKTCKILGASCYLTEGIEQSSIRFHSTSDYWEDRPPSELYQSICVIG